jgi:hypothetical protein
VAVLLVPVTADLKAVLSKPLII